MAKLYLKLTLVMLLAWVFSIPAMAVTSTCQIPSSGNTVVIFWAPWCGPCVAMRPTMEEIQNNNADIPVMKVNTDECAAAATKYSVKSIPQILIIKSGSVTAKFVGATSTETIQKAINESFKTGSSN
jgi:thioredoxin 1